jgi:vesicle-fusing ATPase
MADFERALSEVKPAFGAVTETLEQYRLNGMVDSGEHFRHLQSTCRNLVEQVMCRPLTGTAPAFDWHCSCL